MKKSIYKASAACLKSVRSCREPLLNGHRWWHWRGLMKDNDGKAPSAYQQAAPRLSVSPRLSILCMTAFIYLTTFLSASASATTKTLHTQRYNYEIAKSQLQRQDYDAYFKSRAKLGDYPLTQYLDYQYASQSLYPLKKAVVESFIKKNKGSYLGERLHRRYLHVLGESGNWADLVYWYSGAVATKEINCRWLEGRFQLGESTALENVKEIWVSSKSQPKACDSLFDTWFDSEYYKDDYAWERFILAATYSKRGLARYVGSTLPEEHYKSYVDLVWELDARPYRIKKMNRFRRQTLEMQQIIAFGIHKFARNNPVEAAELWEKYEASMIFDEALTRRIKIRLVNQLLKKKEMRHVQSMLASTPSIRQTKVIERLLRAQLREKNWQDVLLTIDLLDDKSRNSDRWRYWQVRASLELGELDQSEAQQSFENLAQERSFYGFLSADKVKTKYALSHQPTSFPKSTLDNLAKRPDFRRAKELWLQDHLSEAHAEWYYGLQKLSARELAAAGVLANSWGWYDRGIHAMIAGKHWNHLDVRFPLAYKEHILDAADKTTLNPSFIFAVARQESAMSEQAISSAGARGLMQLMPKTAEYTALKQGIRHHRDDLYEAKHNIQLGSQYLDELVTKFNGNRILAAAAYNAGPHRVDRWTQGDLDLDFDIWIETIPFKETRGYVQNVLTYAVIYSLRMGSPAQLVTNSEAKQKL